MLTADPAARRLRHRPGQRRSRRRRAARRLREPPRNRLPRLLGAVQRRRPPAGARGPYRRQGHPRIGRCAPVRVRHPHRPLLRPGPRPPHARQDRAARAAPAATPKTGAARTAATSPAQSATCDEDPRLGRPLCARLLRLRGRGAVQLPRGHAVQAVHHLPAPAPGPARRASPASGCAPTCASATSRSPNTRHAASSTSTP